MSTFSPPDPIPQVSPLQIDTSSAAAGSSGLVQVRVTPQQLQYLTQLGSPVSVAAATPLSPSPLSPGRVLDPDAIVSKIPTDLTISFESWLRKLFAAKGPPLLSKTVNLLTKVANASQ